MLYLARADAGLSRSSSKQINLGPCMEQAYARARPTAIANQQNLLFDAPTQEIRMEQGDDDQLRRLMIILLDNAMKYTPAGGSIHLWCETAPTTVVIHVRDNGRGIDPEKIPYIFERFFRIESSSDTPLPPGTGLGLAIAKQITSNHHGEIYAVSSLGKGAEFCVSLPCTLEASCDEREPVAECKASIS